MKRSKLHPNEPLRVKHLKCSDANTNISLNYKILFFLLYELGKSFDTYLDIGSQEGQFPHTLNENIEIANTTCMDINKNTVVTGKKRFPQYKWICTDVTHWEGNERYELISILNGLFYFYSNKLIKKLYKMLLPGGNIVISYGDKNFSKRKITSTDIINSFKASGFKLKNITKVYETNNAKSKVHMTNNAWYTSIIFTK